MMAHGKYTVTPEMTGSLISGFLPNPHRMYIPLLDHPEKAEAMVTFFWPEKEIYLVYTWVKLSASPVRCLEISTCLVCAWEFSECLYTWVDRWTYTCAQ